MQMTKKNIAVLSATILAFGFLAWQIYGLVKEDSSNSRVAAAASDAARLDANSSAGQATIASNSNAVDNFSQSAPRHPNLQSQSVSVLSKDPVNNSAKQAAASSIKASQALPNTIMSASDASTAAQSKYLKLANQLELMKMQRQVLDERAAIAKSQQQIAELNQKTAGMGGNTGLSNILGGGNNNAPLRLVYVDKQNGQWTATVAVNGQYQALHSGSRLADGSKILAVNKKSVVLAHAGQREALTFSGLSVLPKLSPKAMLANRNQTAAEKLLEARRQGTEQGLLGAPKVVGKAVLAKVKPAQPASNAKKSNHPLFQQHLALKNHLTQQFAKQQVVAAGMNEKTLGKEIVKTAQASIAAKPEKDLSNFTAKGEPKPVIKKAVVKPSLPSDKQVAVTAEPELTNKSSESTKLAESSDHVTDHSSHSQGHSLDVTAEFKTHKSKSAKSVAKGQMVVLNGSQSMNFTTAAAPIEKKVAHHPKRKVEAKVEKKVKPKAEPAAQATVKAIVKSTVKPIVKTETAVVEHDKTSVKLAENKAVVAADKMAKTSAEKSAKNTSDETSKDVPLVISGTASGDAAGNSSAKPALVENSTKENAAPTTDASALSQQLASSPDGNAKPVEKTNQADNMADNMATSKADDNTQKDVGQKIDQKISQKTSMTKNTAATTSGEASTAKSDQQLLTLSNSQTQKFNTIEANANNEKMPKNVTKDEEKLLTAAKSDYTLQFMGSRHKKELQDFVFANQLGNQAKYFHTYYLGKDWYVLVYGDYKSADLAHTAINQLPKTVQELHPWVRPLLGVQEAIKATG